MSNYYDNDKDKIIKRINDRIIDYRSADIEQGDPDAEQIKEKGVKGIDEMDRIYSNFKIHDRVVAFFDGREWNVIGLDFMLSHPILIYRHWSDKDQVYYDNTLMVCPFTLRTMIYKGRIRIDDIRFGYELVLKNEDTEDIFPISNPYTGHYDESGQEKKIKSQVKRHEVKILEHRDIFAFDSDPKYVTIEVDETDMILDQKYYNNKEGAYEEHLSTVFHPKSLVYVVQHYSKTDNAYRHLVLIPTRISRDVVTGYRYKMSRFWAYSEENKDKLIEKRAFTYPMLWHTIEKVKLSNYDVQIVI